MQQAITVVAGASRGAGKGVALALGEAGALVYVLGRSTDARPHPEIEGTIEQTAREVNELSGTGIAYACDCGDEAALRSFFQHVKEQHGRLDLLVNAAWGLHDVAPHFGRFDEHIAVSWEYMFERGVRNYLLTATTAAGLLMETGNSLLVSISFWDDDRYTGHLMYDLSKHTMNRMIFGLGKEMAEATVTTIALSPGFMRTEHVLKALSNTPDLKEEDMPKESTRYVGRAVAALLTDESRHSKTGKALRVADLAREYGFTDLDGTQPAAFSLKG